MNANASVMIASQGTAPAPVPGMKEARAWTLLGVFGLAVGGLILLLLVSAGVMIHKRRRRLAALKSDTQRRRSMDPWAEAGRRAETPSAEDLEERSN
ncbi:MAG: hypothetical protein GIKADHBN_01067 [Phycisphaerales bacterium]|nr:hypothetical protein [Phycisphaerales bacterium]